MGVGERSRVQRALPWDLDIRSVQFFFFFCVLKSCLKWDWLLEAGYQKQQEERRKALRFNLENPLGWEWKELLNESINAKHQGSL